MTAQVDEILIFNGNKTLIAFHPPLPSSHPGIMKVEDSKIADSVIGSTACWRGYIGTWEIQNDRLYLVSIVGCYQMVNDAPIFAHWVSGLICVPQGKLVYCDRSGAKVYEQEIHLRIEQGKVMKSTIIDSNCSQS
ncbi:hypothetical protein [Leptolyngbya sp. FACHB-16]|uniref:hypothetical protein n=1 Tax=unclassified Leptolyngbya TaxID=2650499 RepID=UPI0016839452|nr:hypothetical protein [Leptolyngbya sp. FACHB-16]MBD2155207.1 hypothetical protein [Leptolyngbya sp. FACHB-16]